MERGRSHQSAPGLGLSWFFQLDHNHFAQVGQRFVHRHPSDALDAQFIFQKAKKKRFVAHSFDDARFAGCHLARPRDQDRILFARNAGDLHEGIHHSGMHVAVGLSKRAFGFHIFRGKASLDHDLSLSRDFEINGLALD